MNAENIFLFIIHDTHESCVCVCLVCVRVRVRVRVFGLRVCSCMRQTGATRRVLKVKVQSEGLQDLNDPATKAAILKQVRVSVRSSLWNPNMLTAQNTKNSLLS